MEKPEPQIKFPKKVKENQSFQLLTKEIIPALEKIHGKAWLVGGAVRDILLGQTPNDFDVEVYGITEEGLETCLQNLRVTISITHHAQFGIWQIEGLTTPLSLSLPRLEQQTNATHTGFAIQLVPDLDIETAIQRRDFTVNALLADPLTGNLVDTCNGQRDLATRRLRPVNIDTFHHDGLRAWRAIQYIGRFGFRPTKALLSILQKMAQSSEIALLSGPRIRAELDKLFAESAQVSEALHQARSLGLLQANLPELLMPMNKWRTVLTSLDAIDPKKTTEPVKVRWQTLLGTITPQAAQEIKGRLQLPKGIL